MKEKHDPMSSFCEQAGCSEKERRAHSWKWNVRRWHSHPIPTFVAWFEPTGSDPESGASVGGHPDAYRVWARKDPGRWIRRRFGVPTAAAWNVARYVEEFELWTSLGSPEPETPFVSIAVELGRQREVVRACFATLREAWSKKKPSSSAALPEEGISAPS